VFGTDVGTQELIEAGFDGFPYILSRIAKRTVFKMELLQVFEDEKMANANQASGDEPMNVDGSKDLVKEAENKQSPVFMTELLLNSEAVVKHLYFAPSLDEYLELVDTLLKVYLSVVDAVPSLTNTIEYLNPENQSGDSNIRGLEEMDYGEGPQIGSIITEGVFFREICGRIRGSFMGIFANARKWMMSHDAVRNMWIENEKFGCLSELEIAAGSITLFIVNANSQQVEGGITSALNGYVEENPQDDSVEEMTMGTGQISLLKLSSTIKQRGETYYSPVVDFFDKSLEKFASQLATMNNIPKTQNITNILVQNDRLMQVLLPSPTRCFNDVADILPALARDKNELLLSEVQGWVRILQSPPQNVDAFVEYLGWLETGMVLYLIYV
jgi:dynein heavy chain